LLNAMMLAAAAAYSISMCSALPVFSWSTIPLYVHCANASGPLSAEFAAKVAKTSFITLVKNHCQQCDPVNHGAEGKMVAEAKRLKALNPKLEVMMYFAADFARTWYDAGVWFDQHPQQEVRNDSSGKLVGFKQEGSPATGWHAFDYSSSTAVNRWVATITDNVATGFIDGAFVDGLSSNGSWTAKGGILWGCNKTHQQAFLDGLAEAQRMLGAKLGPNRLVFANMGSMRPGDNAQMMEFFAAQTGFMKILEGFAPHYVEVHAYDPHSWKANLATYLLGAGQNAYWNLGSGQWDCGSWNRWYPEYDRALGAPVTNATAMNANKTVWTRSFASGTTVYLDGRDGHRPRTCIRWSDGNTTSCPPAKGVTDPGCSGAWYDGNTPGCDEEAELHSYTE